MGKDKGGNGGLIVNIASVAGLDCSQFCTPTYNATKHAVVAFSRSLGVSLKTIDLVFDITEYFPTIAG